MINWRNGKGGFVGAQKRLIKGVFQYSHTITTETVTITLESFGVNSFIDAQGQGVIGIILAKGQGVTGQIDESFGVSSIISSVGQGVTGDIDDTGQGVDGS